MSQKRISNEAVVPTLVNKGEIADDSTQLNTEIFVSHPDARFALGVVSLSTLPPEGLEDAFTAYLQLRANVYIDQKQFLSDEAKRHDGTEVDGDDKRSTHIAVFENRKSHIAVVSSMRVIEKNKDSAERLPVESYFDETFEKSPVPVGGNEISRYIMRLDDRKAASQIRVGLFATALAAIHKNGLTPTLAIVEEDLEQSLQRNGVPLKRVAEPRWIEEYNSSNIGIEIDTDTFVENLGGSQAMYAIPTEPGQFTYWK